VVQDVIGVIRRLKGEGVGVLVVEQNVETALAIADRAYVLDRGSVAWSGDAAALRADAPLRRRLLAA
jgi:branched-chain amino acid transport system ATP-binding protein